MHGKQITPGASVESGAGPCCAGGGHPGRAGGKTEEDPREAGVQDAGCWDKIGTYLDTFRETFLWPQCPDKRSWQCVLKLVKLAENNQVGLPDDQRELAGGGTPALGSFARYQLA